MNISSLDNHHSCPVGHIRIVRQASAGIRTPEFLAPRAVQNSPLLGRMGGEIKRGGKDRGERQREKKEDRRMELSK